MRCAAIEQTEAAASRRNWRRTSFRRLDGSIDLAPDDWTLFDDNGTPIARIYHYGFGPNAGKWAWVVLIAPDGVPADGWDGLAKTGREARERCELILSQGAQERPFARMREGE